jgi:hypothetical protein
MSPRLRRAVALAVSAAWLCAVTPHGAGAQPKPADDARAQAGEHFDRGIELFNENDNAGALAEFKRAYDLVADPVVLYNIGLVYSAMRRPVECVDALDKVIASPGTLAEDRLARAKQTRADAAKRIGQVNVVTSAPATIEIDNVDVAKTPLTSPLRVAEGLHHLGAYATGYAPARTEFSVSGGDTAEVKLDLVPMQGKLAHVALTTHLPAADVVVDDQVVGKTPLTQTLTVAPGPHKIELRRPGYVTARQDVQLGDGASADVSMEPDEDVAAVARDGGSLALQMTESQAVVTIDGKRRGVYLGALVVPVGVHSLLVERGGFVPVAREVTVDAGHMTTVRVVLDPTPDTRAAYVSRTTSQRSWGIVSVVAGLVTVGTGVGILVWNVGQVSDAQNTYNAVAASIANPAPGSVCYSAGTTFNKDACNAPLNTARDRINAGNGWNVAGYSVLGVGAAALVLGGYLLFSNDDPHRYDRTSGGGVARGSVVPFAWGDPRGAGVGFQGSF